MPSLLSAPALRLRIMISTSADRASRVTPMGTAMAGPSTRPLPLSLLLSRVLLGVLPSFAPLSLIWAPLPARNRQFCLSSMPRCTPCCHDMVGVCPWPCHQHGVVERRCAEHYAEQAYQPSQAAWQHLDDLGAWYIPYITCVCAGKSKHFIRCAPCKGSASSIRLRAHKTGQ